MWHHFKNIVHILHITVQSCYMTSKNNNVHILHIAGQSCYSASYKEHCAHSPYYCTIMLYDIKKRTLLTFSILLHKDVMWHIKNIVYILHITALSCYATPCLIAFWKRKFDIYNLIYYFLDQSRFSWFFFYVNEPNNSSLGCHKFLILHSKINVIDRKNRKIILLSVNVKYFQK